MQIHIVAPITTPGLSTLEHFAPHAREDSVLTHAILDRGPASLESQYDEALAVPDILTKLAVAQAAGAEAAVIDCMGDPGLAAAREATSMLVMGPAQASMLVALMLARQFSIVTTAQSVVPLLSDLAARYGVESRLRSIRAVDVPVLSLGDEERLRAGLFRESLAAVEQDQAHAIVFGCTGMRGWADAVSAHLAANGHEGIPVIDPAPTALKLAEALGDLGLRPSRATYPRPQADKGVTGYDDVVAAAHR